MIQNNLQSVRAPQAAFCKWPFVEDDFDGSAVPLVAVDIKVVSKSALSGSRYNKRHNLPRLQARENSLEIGGQVTCGRGATAEIVFWAAAAFITGESCRWEAEI
jgi:hypothetical protein